MSRPIDKPITVVVVDDEALVRGGFRAILDHQADITVVGEAASGAEAIRVCQEQAPDVVLMDLRMPGMDGIAATRQLVGLNGLSLVRILILTTFDLDEHIYAALSAGASGFLTKDTPPERVSALTPRELDVLREIARGDTNAQIAGRLFLSEATIKTHVTRILSKLGLPDRVHAVVLAYECGLIRPGQT